MEFLTLKVILLWKYQLSTHDIEYISYSKCGRQKSCNLILQTQDGHIRMRMNKLEINNLQARIWWFIYN